MLDHHRGIDGVVERLAHELVVERLVRDVHRQEIHSQPFDFFRTHPRMLVQAGDLLHRNIVDHVALSCQQAGHPSRILADFFQHDFFDGGLRSPVIIVARHDEIAVALPTHEFIRSGADRVLIDVVAVFLRRALADNKAVLQPVENNRVRHRSREDHGIIVRRLDFGQVVEI